MLGRIDRNIVAAAISLSVGFMTAQQAYSQRPPIVPPHPTNMVKPDCSAGKSCHGIHGLVVVTVDVLEDGTVGETTVKSGDPRLTEDALKAAKACRFRPGTFNGKPTSMNFDLKYQF